MNDHKTYSNLDLAILADGEAAMRYAKLADAAQSNYMRADYRKCAMESATARAIKINRQSQPLPPPPTPTTHKRETFSRPRFRIYSGT